MFHVWVDGEMLEIYWNAKWLFRCYTCTGENCGRQLWQIGHFSVVFVDDSYLQGATEQEYSSHNVFETTSPFESIGFVSNPGKSFLKPRFHKSDNLTEWGQRSNHL